MSLSPVKRRVFPAALFALALAQAVFAAAYVAHEHTIYFWDHAMYHTMARALAAAFEGGFGQGLALLRRSLGQDYNYLFALPSAVAFGLFGNGRAAFVLANFLVFFVPFEIAVAFVLRRVFGLNWRLALLLGFGACSLPPPLWVPLLEGYPDVAAAACIVFALDVLLKPSGGWRGAVLAGLLLGLAVLLRRHFAYAALVLLLVSSGSGLFGACARKSATRWREVRRLVLFHLLCGLVALGLIAVVAPDFVLKALTVDYGALYLSYKQPAGVFLVFAVSGFGYMLALAALGGFALAARKFPAARRGLAFVASVTLIWLVVWCLGPSQAGHHYVLQILPLFAVVGLAGLFLSLPLRFAFACAVLLAANSAWALWLAPRGVPPNDHGAPRLFSAPRPPVVRGDIGELTRLGRYLEETTTDKDRIFVLGSSFVFNQDIVRAVFTDVLKRTAPLPRFLFAPEIDSREDLPLNAFAAATVYVAAEPPQFHLDPEAQKVVAAPAAEFPPPASRSALFSEDAPVFRLENGVEVRVWRRAPWTPGMLHAALADLRRLGPPGRQDWVTLAGPRQTQVATGARRADVYAVFEAAGSELNLFYDLPLTAGDYRLSVVALPLSGCRDPAFELTAMTEEGKEAATGRFAPTLVPGPALRAFSLPISPPGPFFLRLKVTAGSPFPCQLLLQQLTVSTQ